MGVNFTTYQDTSNQGTNSGGGATTKSGGLLSRVGDKLKSKVGSVGNAKAAGDKGAGDLGEMDTGMASAKKGGRVKKSGYVKLHKGEKVLTRKQAKKSGHRKRA